MPATTILTGYLYAPAPKKAVLLFEPAIVPACVVYLASKIPDALEARSVFPAIASFLFQVPPVCLRDVFHFPAPACIVFEDSPNFAVLQQL